LAGSHSKENLSCREIVSHLLDSIKNIRTQHCDVKSVEHINGHLLFAESILKMNMNPKKIYYKNIFKGNEVLWIQGKNKENATVHSRTLPLINLNLDPYGNLMRKDSHHTIFDLGFPYIGSIIANTIVKSPKDFDKHFAYPGTIVWNHIECYQVIISFPEYKYIEYTAVKGETANSIAKKFSTSDFKIRNKNGLPSYDGFIKEGKKLLIPTSYGNKVIVYVDKKTYMPISVKIYDEEGLFEDYAFYNVKINTAFASDEFSEKFKGYGF
jgi:hypothetical protein